MITRTLSDLCKKQIAINILNAPPLIQEMILETTVDEIKNELRSEIEAELRKEPTYLSVCETFISLLPDMLIEYVNNRLNPVTIQNNTVELDAIKSNIDNSVVSAVLETVKIASDMYIIPKFEIGEWSHDGYNTYLADYNGDY